MIRNYFLVAIRNLLRHRLFSLTNSLSLSIGMACCILILLFAYHELRYDQHFKNADQIYRVALKMGSENAIREEATTPYLLAPTLLEALPKVARVTRLHVREANLGSKAISVRSGEKQFFEDRILFADPSLFEVFDFPFVEGSRETALAAPFSVLLTETMAQKYFDNVSPVGDILTLTSGQGEVQDFTVTGVVKDVPDNSHFHFDFLVSLSSWVQEIEKRSSKFFSPSFLLHRTSVYTYVLLPEGYSADLLQQKLPNLSDQLYDTLGYVKMVTVYDFFLQPLTQIHFHSHLLYEMEPGGDLMSVYLLLAIAGVILLVACVNFTNLSTVRFSQRAKEVGLRKVVGAERSQLVKQFLGEALFLSFVALVLSVVVVELSLPFFQSFLGKTLSFGGADLFVIVLSVVGVWLFVGFSAGSFPAFVLSSFHPVETLKGTLKSGSGSVLFRRSLVVFQFVVSIGLMIGTVVVYNQQAYMRSKKLGFQKEQMLTFSMKGLLDNYSFGPKSIAKFEAFKRELLRQPGILNVTMSSSVPGKEAVNFVYTPEGAPETEKEWWTTLYVDEDFLETYKIELLSGRNFSRDLVSDKKDAIIVNEEGVRRLRFADPIGHPLPSGFGSLPIRDGAVIGVVKDFHLQSVREKIGPVALSFTPLMARSVSVRVNTGDISGGLANIDRVWQQFAPDFPLSYTFLDDDFDRLYRREVKLTQMFSFFSFWAIFIACLGLFGLASFETERRGKEIGIRKVLGASVSRIVVLLLKEFVFLVLIANAIAWPLAYYAMNHWLQDFAYRIDLNAGLFLLAGALTFLIALTTVGFRALKAAHANPVDALRRG